MNSRKPCLCSRLERRYQQALPSDSPREAHLNTNDCSRWADAPGTKRRLQQVSNTPTHQTPEGHTAEATGLLPLTMQSHPWHPGSRSLASPPQTRLDPLKGGSLTFLARPREFAGFLLCSGAQLKPRGPGLPLTLRTPPPTHRTTKASTQGEQTRCLPAGW